MSKRKPITTASEAKCAVKVRYVTRRVAEIYAARLAELRGVRLYVYKCPHCKKWHHTKKQPRDNPIDDFEVVA
ncbi:hypothetical protein [Bordetella hinzii]|uniref:hypothetical protein n=1 Tax=Bordetella hinzii TaxID=103855 RepID=UPI0039FCE3C1